MDLMVEKPNRKVRLDERKVTPKLYGNQNMSWYLDTGSSNHMTGCTEKFLELELNVEGSEKFGDGSTVEVCGIGTILFKCLTGEHRILTGIYSTSHGFAAISSLLGDLMRTNAR